MINPILGIVISLVLSFGLILFCISRVRVDEKTYKEIMELMRNEKSS